MWLRRFTTLAERLAAEDAEEAEKGGQTNVYRVCACAHPWGDAGNRQASDYLFHRPWGQKVAIVSISPSVARFLALDLLEAACRLERADR